MFFLITSFRLYPGLKLSLEYKIVRKNLVLSACFCWYSTLSLSETDEKIMFGGIIGYGDSFLEFLFHHFKVFRLHAKVHDAAGAVRAPIGNCPSYCFCVLTRTKFLFACSRDWNTLLPLLKTLFFPSVVFWSSVSCIVLDIELSDASVLRSWEFFYGKVQRYSDYSELPNILPSDVKWWSFCKKNRKKQGSWQSSG